jgi:phosphopantothenoylcysteine decarboxylase/phosphopantothenate--cysteine ligase
MFSPENHPSKDIIGSTSQVLKGKTVCMCLTGSIAIMNAPAVARELMRLGADVYAVMTKAATELVSPDLMNWSTGNPVVTRLTGGIEHVALAGDRTGDMPRADIVLVCPATANTISKIAYGIDDTTVTSVVTAAFGSGLPIVIVPAMHESMYRHPILNQNIEKLKALGVEFIGPQLSEGKAKIALTEDIVNRVKDILIGKPDLAGSNVLLTVGATREYFDRVRFVSNPSSGKMGISIAEEVIARGGSVTIIATGGITAVPPASSKARVVEVETTQQLLDAVLEELRANDYDMFISAAAVADFTPVEFFDEKVSSATDELVLHLKPTPKIIKEVRAEFPDLFVVAFKAEVPASEADLVEKAYATLQAAQADLIVANDVGRPDTGFSVPTNEVYIVDRDRNVVHEPLASKRLIATKIVDRIVELLKKKAEA